MKKASISLVIFVLILIFSGCKEEENPVIPPSEHFEPVGWFLHDINARPILIVWEGQIQQTWNDTLISDTLYGVTYGATPAIFVSFLDENKNVTEFPKDEDYTFDWAITDTSITSIMGHEPGWAFHIAGKQAGVTTIELQVLHLGHVDVRTPKIPVRIDQ